MLVYVKTFYCNNCTAVSREFELCMYPSSTRVGSYIALRKLRTQGNLSIKDTLGLANLP